MKSQAIASSILRLAREILSYYLQDIAEDMKNMSASGAARVLSTLSDKELGELYKDFFLEIYDANSLVGSELEDAVYKRLPSIKKIRRPRFILR